MASSSKRTIEFVLKASDGGYSSTVRKAADATKDAADKAKSATKATEGLGMAASGAATPLAAMVTATSGYASDAEKATTAGSSTSAKGSILHVTVIGSPHPWVGTTVTGKPSRVVFSVTYVFATVSAGPVIDRSREV